MGQQIIQHGILATDPFSYTMPTYNFIDHEWLSNVLIAVGYKTLGVYGLSIIFTVIFVASLLIVIPKQFKNYVYLPLLLSGTIMLSFFGVRTQVITWFFLSILLRVIFDENLWKKWKFFLPLLFIPWVNLHGGFAIGIALLSLVFVLKSAQNRKFEANYFVVCLFSLILTFINPYGVRIWWEIWMQISDGSLRWNIAEWTPAIFYVDFALFILFTVSLFLLFKYRAKIGGVKTMIYLFLLLMAVSSIRHLPLWGLSAILITAETIGILLIGVKKNKYAIIRLRKLKKILFVVIAIVFICQVYVLFKAAPSLSEQGFYPVQAVKFLQASKLNGNLFTSYNYAGYLLWKLPSKKDFIDGRMPSWRRNGYFKNESNYAFKDYLTMTADEKYFKKMLQKYNIRYVLFPAPQKTKGKKNAYLVQLNEYLERFEFWHSNTKVMDEDLRKVGMKIMYNDGKFVIYKN